LWMNSCSVMSVKISSVRPWENCVFMMMWRRYEFSGFNRLRIEVLCWEFGRRNAEATGVFEQQYDDEMAAEIRRLEGKARAAASGHPEWQNACAGCGCELSVAAESCERCHPKTKMH